MGSVLIVRHGAYGDMIHCTHLPRLLHDQGFNLIGLSTVKRGLNIFKNNPFIDKIHYSELGVFTRVLTLNYFNGRLNYIGRDYDKVVNLNQTIEVGALPGQHQPEFFADQKTRDLIGSENYYDIATRVAGYSHLIGQYKGELYFSKSEEEIVLKGLEKYKGRFKVMINLSGSSPHKAFVQASEVVDKITGLYPEAIVFTTGDEASKSLDSKRDDVIHMAGGKKPFRQALCMVKFMDLVIGCESGLMVGSSCLGTPTIQLLTATSIYNHCKYADNDYSLQSPCRCSPCFKNPYDYWGCPKKNYYPLCVYFDVDKIMEQIRKVHEKWREQTLALTNSNT